MPVEVAPWGVEQVLALAPDDASRKAGQKLSSPTPWQSTGVGGEPASVWGLCAGSGKNPYQTCVDLTEPAYKCSCPSRKFPCKHALGLLLLWSSGEVTAAEPPDWVQAWHDSRGERKAKQAQRTETVAEKQRNPTTAARREQRVEAGIEELERWLTDQLRGGLAGAGSSGYEHWDAMAARLVDAQAGGLAGSVRRLAMVAGDPERLLSELGLLWLLTRAYGRLDELPAPLQATVRTRVGFNTPTEEVLAGPRMRDRWGVVGMRDEVDERLTTRRTWLHGATTGRPALVLAFAGPGQQLPADLILGTSIDADLCFYPGAAPLRALVAHRHSEPLPLGSPGGPTSVAAALDEHARALAADPWLERWPMLLDQVTPAGPPWMVVDGTGAALPLDVPDPWRLIAAAGGAPCTIAGEFSAHRGLRPLALWGAEGMVRL